MLITKIEEFAKKQSRVLGKKTTGEVMSLKRDATLWSEVSDLRNSGCLMNAKMLQVLGMGLAD